MELWRRTGNPGGGLWVLVGGVQAYKRADRGGLRSDRIGSGIGDPFRNLQYM